MAKHHPAHVGPGRQFRADTVEKLGISASITIQEAAGSLDGNLAVFQNSAWLARIQIDCTQSKFVAMSGAAAPADDHRHSGPRV
jgi:hypothetical protein